MFLMPDGNLPVLPPMRDALQSLVGWDLSLPLSVCVAWLHRVGYEESEFEIARERRLFLDQMAMLEANGYPMDGAMPPPKWIMIHAP